MGHGHIDLWERRLYFFTPLEPPCKMQIRTGLPNLVERNVDLKVQTTRVPGVCVCVLGDGWAGGLAGLSHLTCFPGITIGHLHVPQLLAGVSLQHCQPIPSPTQKEGNITPGLGTLWGAGW